MTLIGLALKYKVVTSGKSEIEALREVKEEIKTCCPIAFRIKKHNEKCISTMDITEKLCTDCWNRTATEEDIREMDLEIARDTNKLKESE